LVSNQHLKIATPLPFRGGKKGKKEYEKNKKPEGQGQRVVGGVEVGWNGLNP